MKDQPNDTVVKQNYKKCTLICLGFVFFNLIKLNSEVWFSNKKIIKVKNHDTVWSLFFSKLVSSLQYIEQCLQKYKVN